MAEGDGETSKDFKTPDRAAISISAGTKKERLRLGYSNERIRNQRLVGETYGPLEGRLEGSSAFSHEQSPITKAYNELNKYADLNELGAPSPINGEAQNRIAYIENGRNESPHASRIKTGNPEYLEPNGVRNLDELAAPSPIDKEVEKQEPHLEDRDHVQSVADIEASRVENPFQIQHQNSKLTTELYIISHLIFFSILGTLARIGLQALTSYPGAPVQTGLLWANVGGSLVMGFLSEDRNLFRTERRLPSDLQNGAAAEGKVTNTSCDTATEKAHGAVKKTIPLYIGLATGFCGSFTSFSSFIRDAFYALANALPVPVSHPSTTPPLSPISASLNVPRNGGYSFMALLAVLITTLGLSMAALKTGAHLALFLELITPSISSPPARRITDWFFVFLAFTTWLGTIIMTALPPDRPGGTLGYSTWSQETWRSKALFALVFAPLGCLLRFYASIHLNGRIKSFPLGTFTVNIIGSALEAVFIDLQRARVGELIGCQVLQGMSDGFCGCLTTVSTWVAEISGLRRRHSYVYALVSMGVALALYVVITGSLLWTQGFRPILCTT